MRELCRVASRVLQHRAPSISQAPAAQAKKEVLTVNGTGWPPVNKDEKNVNRQR